MVKQKGVETPFDRTCDADRGLKAVAMCRETRKSGRLIVAGLVDKPKIVEGPGFCAPGCFAAEEESAVIQRNDRSACRRP